jgi:hypothetical protein
MNLQEQISRIQEMMKLNESNFFHRRVDLDEIKRFLPLYADNAFQNTSSYKEFRYSLCLDVLEDYFYSNYGINRYDLPQEETIEFAHYLANMYEPLISGLYKDLS